MWRCFLRAVSYCCNILKARDKSSTRQGAGRYLSCVCCTIRFEDILHGTKRPTGQMAATAEKGRPVQSLKEIGKIVSTRAEGSGVVRS